MKYKVGDKVVLKGGLNIDETYGGYFPEYAACYGNTTVEKEVEIIVIRSDAPPYYYCCKYLTTGEAVEYITDEMIKCKIEEKTETKEKGECVCMKYKVGDEVLLKGGLSFYKAYGGYYPEYGKNDNKDHTTEVRASITEIVNIYSHPYYIVDIPGSTVFTEYITDEMIEGKIEKETKEAKEKENELTDADKVLKLVAEMVDNLPSAVLDMIFGNGKRTMLTIVKTYTLKELDTIVSKYYEFLNDVAEVHDKAEERHKS